MKLLKLSEKRKSENTLDHEIVDGCQVTDGFTHIIIHTPRKLASDNVQFSAISASINKKDTEKQQLQ